MKKEKCPFCVIVKKLKELYEKQTQPIQSTVKMNGAYAPPILLLWQARERQNEMLFLSLIIGANDRSVYIFMLK